MLKTLTLAGGLALAAFTLAPQAASAASFGNQADVAATAPASVEQAQYYYGPPRRRYRGYGYGPRRGYYARPYRRPYYGRPYYARPYGYGYRRPAPGLYFGF